MQHESKEAQLLSLRPMALRLGIHPRELRVEAEREGVPCVRVGARGLLFDPAAVLERLRQRAQPASSKREEVAHATP